MHNPKRIYKSSVETYEIDNMGHMNVQFYVQHAINACELFLRNENLIQSDQCFNSLFKLEKLFIRYLREQTLGVPFSISVNYLSVDMSEIVIFLEMKNLLINDVSAAFVFSFSLHELKQKKKMTISAITEKLFSSPLKVPLYGKKKGLSGLAPLDLSYSQIKKLPKLLEPYYGIVTSKGYSIAEELSAADYMGIISKAVPHLLLQGDHSIANTNIGGAALEYEFRFKKFASSGCGVFMKSGLRQINAKTYTWTHWLIEAATTEVLAVADSVIISMDLRTRKAIQMPKRMWEELNKILVA